MEEVCDRLNQLESLNIKIIALESDININQQLSSDTPVRKTALLRLLNQIRQNQHSRKIRQAYARQRIKSILPPGKAPYGYRSGQNPYALDRSAAPVVKGFFWKPSCYLLPSEVLFPTSRKNTA